jgi:hypothetical protein
LLKREIQQANRGDHDHDLRLQCLSDSSASDQGRILFVPDWGSAAMPLLPCRKQKLEAGNRQRGRYDGTDANRFSSQSREFKSLFRTIWVVAICTCQHDQFDQFDHPVSPGRGSRGATRGSTRQPFEKLEPTPFIRGAVHPSHHRLSYPASRRLTAARRRGPGPGLSRWQGESDA